LSCLRHKPRQATFVQAPHLRPSTLALTERITEASAPPAESNMSVHRNNELFLPTTDETLSITCYHCSRSITLSPTLPPSYEESHSHQLLYSTPPIINSNNQCHNS
jgi:hypothetical protein